MPDRPVKAVPVCLLSLSVPNPHASLVTVQLLHRLFQAAQDNKVHLLEHLLETEEGAAGLVNASFECASLLTSGRTMIHAASLKGNLECIDLLIRHGADVNAADDSTCPLCAWFLRGLFRWVHAAVCGCTVWPDCDRGEAARERGAGQRAVQVGPVPDPHRGQQRADGMRASAVRAGQFRGGSR